MFWTIGLSKYGPGADIHHVPIWRKMFTAPSTMLSTKFVIVSLASPVAASATAFFPLQTKSREEHCSGGPLVAEDATGEGDADGVGTRAAMSVTARP